MGKFCLLCFILALPLALPLILPLNTWGEILSHESSVGYKNVQKIQPMVSINKDSMEQTSQETAQPIQEYNMLSEIDVFSLSPNAKLLLLPHILTYQSYQEWENQSIDWAGIIRSASLKYDVAENLIAAVIKAESNFIAHAVSPVGARGAMQIMPETGLELELSEPFDPKQNVEAGTRYLKEQINRFQSLELALAAYNAGPGNVIKYNGIPPFKETQDFVAKVIAAM